MRWRSVCASMLAVAWGCTPTHEDSSGVDCAKFDRTFFNKPVAAQATEFRSLEIATQYAVFICGIQLREPPSIYVATFLAKEGESAVDFLKEKLAAARGDLTINDIIIVFRQMSRQETYNVGDDRELMRVIGEAVDRMKDPYWRRRSEQALVEIRRESKTGTRR